MPSLHLACLPFERSCQRMVPTDLKQRACRGCTEGSCARIFPGDPIKRSHQEILARHLWHLQKKHLLDFLMPLSLRRIFHTWSLGPRARILVFWAALFLRKRPARVPRRGGTSGFHPASCRCSQRRVGFRLATQKYAFAHRRPLWQV